MGEKEKVNERTGGTEFLFIYDVKYANPNGDPNNNNMCRQDPDTEKIFTTPFKEKRVTRDFAFYYKGFNGKTEGKDIFVRKVNNESVTNDARVKQIAKESTNIEGIIDELNKSALDFRWFGALITAEKGSSKDAQKKSGGIIGPIQLGFGISLHKARCVMVKGTSVFASSDKKKSGTMTEYYMTPYALISVPGIINRTMAKELNVNLTEDDIDLFFECLWKGTLMRRSTSKNQMPRFLVRIDYKDDYKDFFIGDLEDMVKVIPHDGLSEESIRSPSDYDLDVSELCSVLDGYKDKIEEITFYVSPRINLKPSVSELEGHNWVKKDMYEKESKKEGQP